MNRRDELLAWGEQWHYPQLVLSDQDIIRHGEDAWKAFVADRGRKRKMLAWQRIQAWNERLTREQTA